MKKKTDTIKGNGRDKTVSTKSEGLEGSGETERIRDENNHL
jgi:hypothetical protein